MGAARSTSRITLSLGLLLTALDTSAAGEFINVRNYAPFSQLYGLPGFANATVLAPRQTSVSLTSTVINHSDIDSEIDSEIGLEPGETLMLDGETYITELTVGFGVSDRLSVALDVPWVAYTGGVFDGAIESWHDLWGFPNGVRGDQPDDELLINYLRDGVNEFSLGSSGSGIGDIRLQAAYRLAGTHGGDHALVMRAGVKVPSGSARHLRGSGATDFSLDLAVRKAFALPRGELVLSAHAGALLLGNGDVLSQQQRDTVGFAGAGAIWRLTERWRFNLQFYGQSSYFHSDLDTLGSGSVSMTVGGSYTWLEPRMRLALGIMEDPFDDTTPDVALHIELTKDFH
jgi:hypothetical protein